MLRMFSRIEVVIGSSSLFRFLLPFVTCKPRDTCVSETGGLEAGGEAGLELLGLDGSLFRLGGADTDLTGAGTSCMLLSGTLDVVLNKTKVTLNFRNTVFKTSTITIQI